jgi:hypothetical protein
VAQSLNPDVPLAVPKFGKRGLAALVVVANVVIAFIG